MLAMLVGSGVGDHVRGDDEMSAYMMIECLFASQPLSFADHVTIPMRK